MNNTELSISNILKNSDCHHLSLLATNPGNKFFSSIRVTGTIAYKIHGNHIFMIGGILAKKEHKIDVYQEFYSFAKENKKKIIAIYLSPDDLEIFNRYNYSINQFGSSYTIDLKHFSFADPKYSAMRNKVNKARRKGIIVNEVINDQNFSSLKDRLDEIDSDWLSIKGGKPLTFMVTDRSMLFPSENYRLFIATLQNKILAYILYTRSYGEKKGWIHDLSRQSDNAPMGILPLINIEAISEFTKTSDKYLHFGFTPLVDLNPEFVLKGKQSRLLTNIFMLLQKYGDFIYPSQGQRQYKMSWRPNIIKPEYIAFEGGFTITALFAFLKITNSL